MSEIKQLLRDYNNILVFDVDGVLAIMEWGKYNHYELTDEAWIAECKKGINDYTEDKVCKKIQNFLKNRNMNNVYVITKYGEENEISFKKEFLSKYYNIPIENMHFVLKDSDKVNELIKIRNERPDVEEYRIVMIEDTVTILNDIMKKTNFSTVHVSSFIDL